ncbi:spore cortex-lytic enzyme [Bacillus phage vB_BpuM-BpSp]|nr:spore cortex-lytic enzyme [Bacillus phage vB_BpuM-BpSp]
MKKVLMLTLLFLLSVPVLSAQAETLYNVKKGDTLWGISRTYNITLSDLRKENNKWDDLILVNQKIKIPEGKVPQYTKKEVSKVKKQSVSEYKSQSKNTSVAQNERELLAKLVRAEAENEPYAGKVAVAKVVLNRVDSPKFPNTITGVIYQRGQFSPVTNGAINRSATAESYRATDQALNTRGQGTDALYFYNPKIATNHWQASLTVVNRIGGHVFSK